LVLLAAILAIGGYLLMWEPAEYDVTFEAPDEYGKTSVEIRSNGARSRLTLTLDPSSSDPPISTPGHSLQQGSHRLRVTPEFAPPFDTTIVLEGRVSERHVRLPNRRGRPVDTVLKFELRDLEEDDRGDWVAGDEIPYQARVNGYEVKSTTWMSGSPEVGAEELERRVGGLHWLTFVGKDGTLHASRARIDMEIIADGLDGAPFRFPIVIPEGASRYLIWTNVSVETARDR